VLQRHAFKISTQIRMDGFKFKEEDLKEDSMKTPTGNHLNNDKSIRTITRAVIRSVIQILTVK
jgi:hypothetical protein